MSCHRIGSAIVCGRGARRSPTRERPRCRVPDCSRYASQAGWGCRPHWFDLPPDLRNRLFLAARDDLVGSAWAAVAAEADAWIVEQLARPAVRVTWREPELPL